MEMGLACVFDCHWLGTPGWAESQLRVTAFTGHSAPGRYSSALRRAAQRTPSERARAVSSTGRRRWRHGEAVRRTPGPGNLGGGNCCHRDVEARYRGPEGAKRGNECPGNAERPGGEPGVAAARRSTGVAGIEQGWRHRSMKGTRVV